VSILSERASISNAVVPMNCVAPDWTPISIGHTDRAFGPEGFIAFGFDAYQPPRGFQPGRRGMDAVPVPLPMEIGRSLQGSRLWLASRTRRSRVVWATGLDDQEIGQRYRQPRQRTTQGWRIFRSQSHF
jgi:hypothetical protein